MIMIQFTELTNTDPESYRAERDRLLLESDWTQGADSPLSDTDKAAWATYRQALRDMTVTYATMILCPKGMMDWRAVRQYPLKP